MKCNNVGCDYNLLQLELEQHMNNECPQRTVTCKDCKEAMCFEKLKVHMLTNYMHQQLSVWASERVKSNPDVKQWYICNLLAGFLLITISYIHAVFIHCVSLITHA